MKKINYSLVDVFTDELFGGNQLAVVQDCDDLPAHLMQKIAKEFNLSETTFVLPPKDKTNDYQVRIFTPEAEIPMAGHPTVGTAFILARKSNKLQSAHTLKLEEGVGVIPVKIEPDDSQSPLITMQQPLPAFGEQYRNYIDIAAMLTLDVEHIDHQYPMEVVSTGVPFLFIKVNGLEAIKNLKLRLDLWEKYLKGGDAQNIFVFCMETEQQASNVHCRMFAPAFGVREDPATGSANGPLGCYLVKHGIVPVEKETNIISEQGFEIGRKSIMNIAIEMESGDISGVKVGGKCVFVGGGELTVP